MIDFSYIFQIKSHGQACENISQCSATMGNHSTCSDATKTCLCLSHSLYYETRCYLKSRLNANCTMSEECEASVKGDVECSPVSWTCECIDRENPTQKGSCTGGASTNHNIDFWLMFLMSAIYMIVETRS